MRISRRRCAGGLAQWAVLVGVLLASGWGILRTLPARAATGGGEIPLEVLYRAQKALVHMKAVTIAMQIYANDHDDRYPADLTVLYPEHVSDPNTFWHPGDSDPRPTTIDNMTPNAPNSAQISFEFDYNPGQTYSRLVVRDWSADNNDGYFILEYDPACGASTIPPGCMPEPYPIFVAQARLRALGQATWIYAYDNNDRFPEDPYALWTSDLIPCPFVVWHPGDSDPQPTDITTGALDEPNSVQVSFELVATGRTYQYSPEDVMWQDNSPDNHGGAGRNVCYIGGHVRFVPIYDFNDINGDQSIDIADFNQLAGCMTGPYRIVTDDFCRHFDEDRDHDVDMVAVMSFMQNFGAVLPATE